MRRVPNACVAVLAALALSITGGRGETDGTDGTGGSGSGDGTSQDGGGSRSEGATENGGPDAQSDDTADRVEGQPDLVGKGLAIAEKRAGDAGFDTEAYDSAGRERTPVIPENWQVCFQDPARASKKEDTGKVIRLGVVRASEDCPEEDQSKQKPELGPDNELPDFAGTSLHVATNALGSSASVNPVDAREGREVFIPQNWKVCDQSPEPGTSWDGEPVTFRVVKYGERCPD